MSYLQRHAAATAVAVGVALVAAVALGVVLGAPAGASHADDGANYTVILPNDDDHLPGDQNPEGGSIKHNAEGGEAFTGVAPNGFETFDRLHIQSDEVDFSACDSDNTAVFGIDRGNNNSGTQIDTDLLQHMKESHFREDGIEVIFYDESDFGGDPTHLRPEDAIVALQGEGSASGACYTMPEEPGWYQITGILEGTTEDGEQVTINEQSHYFPICEGCHDEETARDELGDPPSEESDRTDDTDEETPTPTPTPDDSDTEDTDDIDGETAEDTPTPTPTPTETVESADSDGEESTDSEAGNAGDENADDHATDETDDRDGNMPGTPTPGDGPGFSALAALSALLAAALLARQRA